ncbi:hypothetical protein OU787_08635 [Kitasatospora sp. YST-16]|uniref:hypothetical protein n=1 Tax=unclassified Kitasatospora TaxID=2633591 RepID=UPI0004C3CCCE|nr:MULTISPECIES: hypothetical protein [unclassified Kitasatospora]WAL71564.1 hypothetical protein OU787_08635 [Kitasatospora sp. YST-16]WNW37604.1 hypothetical protein RKE32_08585 [Streptomyces sp. Li-HN-5-13]
MTEQRNVTGGLHISGNAQVTITGAGIAAGQNSSATVHNTAVDEEALVRRVLALVEQLRQSAEPATVRAAEELGQEVAAPARRWERVLAYLTRAGQGVAATAAVATEIQGLEQSVRALLQ